MIVYHDKNIELTKTFVNTLSLKGTTDTKTLYKNLFTEESTEALLGWANKDIKEICDGIGDQMFLDLSLSILGYNNPAINMHVQSTINIVNNCPDINIFINGKDACEILNRVCTSNLSKFDDNLNDVEYTQNSYKLSGIETYYVYNKETNLYLTFSKGDQYDHQGKFYNKDKLLKSSKNFVEPYLNDIVERVTK